MCSLIFKCSHESTNLEINETLHWHLIIFYILMGSQAKLSGSRDFFVGRIFKYSNIF